MDRFYQTRSGYSIAAVRKEPDGLFHKTSVKVKRKGLDLRFRKGYTDDPVS